MKRTRKDAYNTSNEIKEVALSRFRNTEYNKLLSDVNRQKDAQDLINYLCSKFRIPLIPVIVSNKPQPHSTDYNGKLRKKTLGTYTYGINTKITIYNVTAIKKQEVSIKTFAETLLHEFIHHYDMSYLKLGSSPHTSGFYKRISDLEKKLSK